MGGMEANVGGEVVKEGEEIYVSREELLAENPQNPKICGGMEVEFLVAKTSYDKFVACEVTLPGGDPIGDLPEREPKTTGKGRGRAPRARARARRLWPRRPSRSRCRLGPPRAAPRARPRPRGRG